MEKVFEKMIGATVEDLIEELQAHVEVKGWAYDEDYTEVLHLNVDTTEGSFIVCIDEGIVQFFISEEDFWWED